MRLVIVDEADKVIGAKDRGSLKPTDIYRVARLLIINTKGQLLLAQRAFVKEKDPGVWGLAVKGTVEEGEDYEVNIRKEAEEEIGVTLGSLKIGPIASYDRKVQPSMPILYLQCRSCYRYIASASR